MKMKKLKLDGYAEARRQLRQRWFGIFMIAALLLIVMLLSGCYSHTGHRHGGVTTVYEHPGTTVAVNEQTGYLTYRERYGGYTMTPHGYMPMHGAGHHNIRTSTPGYTWSKSVYWDQRPEAFGIYPVRRREVHVTTSTPGVTNQIDYGRLGCALDAGGQPYLREYTNEGTVGGKPVPIYGTACRQPDGDWKLVGNWRLAE